MSKLLTLDEITSKFNNEEVFIIGGGPSLKGFDFSLLKDKNTICVNHSFKDVPNPDVLVFLDWNMVETYIDDEQFRQITKVTSWNLLSTRKEPCMPLRKELEPSTFMTFGNFHSGLGYFKNMQEMHKVVVSGDYALLYAMKCNPSKIYLVGFDGCPPKEGQHNQYHNIHKYMEKTNMYQISAKQHERIKKLQGSYVHYDMKNIINLNPDSCITAWKKEEWPV